MSPLCTVQWVAKKLLAKLSILKHTLSTYFVSILKHTLFTYFLITSDRVSDTSSSSDQFNKAQTSGRAFEVKIVRI